MWKSTEEENISYDFDCTTVSDCEMNEKMRTRVCAFM